MTAANPSIPRRLVSVIDRCLSKEPRDRFTSTSDLARQIHGETVTAPEPSSARHRVAAVGLVGVVSILAVVLVALFSSDVRDRLVSPRAAPPIESIAVLPLENLSGDPEQRYFSEGMTEALISTIGGIRTVSVISRSSVMHYARAPAPLAQIAEELNVDAIIEGSVQRADDRVKITVRLVDAPRESLLWTRSYERQFSDVLSIQDEVATDIAERIHATLSSDEKARFAESRIVSPDAYDEFLKGRYFFNQRSPEGFQKARASFERALEIDPELAEAHAGLADISNALATFYLVSPLDGYASGKRIARRALAIDPDLAAAHAALGVAHQGQWEWHEAERQLQRAIDLNPSYPYARLWYGQLLVYQGRTAEGLAEIDAAARLDPLSLPVSATRGLSLYAARDYDRATEQLHRTLELEPDYAAAPLYLTWCASAQSRRDAALSWARRALELSGTPLFIWNLGFAHAAAGDGTEARKLLGELEQMSSETYVDPGFFWLLHALLGDADAADWLEKSYAERSNTLIYARVLPLMDPLRDDPSFQDLLRRMSFPD